MRAIKNGDPSNENNVDLEEDYLQDEFLENEDPDLSGPQESTEKADKQIKYYHIDEGSKGPLYDAAENENGSWTVFSPEGESQNFSAQEFNMNFMVYQEPVKTDTLATEDNILGDEDGKLDLEGSIALQTDPDSIQDLDAAKDTIRALNEQLAMSQQYQAAIPQGTTEQKIASSAERMVTGLAALGSGLYRGVGKVVEKTKDELIAWQGRQRLYEVKNHVDAAHHHLDTINSNPDFTKSMTAIETGVKSNADVRTELFERFTSEDPKIQGSQLNLAYHQLMKEMSSLSNFDYEIAQDNIDLSEKSQGKAAAELQKGVEGLLDRKELDVLPDANNEEMRKSLENMVKQIQDFFKKLVQRFSAAPQSEEVTEMAPSS